MTAVPDPKHEWHLLIGTFILTFGEIEHSIHLIWRRCFKQRDEPRDLTVRIDKLIGKVKNDATLSKALPELLIEVKRLADYRNAVAHHPLSIQVLRNEVTRKITPVLRITSRTTDTSVTQGQLRKLCRDANHLARQIESAFWLHDIDE